MRDIDVEEDLVLKVGGKFALTALIQKRLVELNRGARPLVQLEGELRDDPRRIVTEEILQGKIELAPRDEVGQVIRETAPAPEPAKVELPQPAAPAPIAEPPAAPAAAASEEGDDVAIYGSDIKKIKEQRIKELSQLLNPKKK